MINVYRFNSKYIWLTKINLSSKLKMFVSALTHMSLQKNVTLISGLKFNQLTMLHISYYKLILISKQQPLVVYIPESSNTNC